MKRDIKELLKYLREFQDSFDVTDTIFHSEKEDTKKLIRIQKIAKKYGLKY